MGTFIGAVAAAVLGLALAAGASQGVLGMADPDSKPGVQAKIHSAQNPLHDPATAYGSR